MQELEQCIKASCSEPRRPKTLRFAAFYGTVFHTI
jgi:hypothetical protein